MKLLDSLRFRLNTLFRRSQVNAEMDDELASRICSFAPTTWSAPACREPRPSGGRASSSAGIRG